MPFATTWAVSVARSYGTVSGGIWVALIGNDTCVSEVVPSLCKVTTLASIVGFVTRDHILWGEDDVVTTFDASSVGENLGGGESPAGSASGLISDGVHAAWPLVDGVEVVWESDVVSENLSLLGWHWWEWSDDGTEEESLDLGLGHS